MNLIHMLTSRRHTSSGIDASFFMPKGKRQIRVLRFHLKIDVNPVLMGS